MAPTSTRPIEPRTLHEHPHWRNLQRGEHNLVRIDKVSVGQQRLQLAWSADSVALRLVLRSETRQQLLPVPIGNIVILAIFAVNHSLNRVCSSHLNPRPSDRHSGTHSLDCSAQTR